MNKIFAVLSYPNSNNLGDFIQSEAAKQFFKNQIIKKNVGNENKIFFIKFLFLIKIINGNKQKIIRENLLEIAKTESKDKYLKLLISNFL